MTVAAGTRERGAPDALLLAGIVALGVLSLLLALASDGNVALAVTPILLTLVVYGVIRAPLRHSLLVLAFLSLTLENPAEAPAMGRWKSPLYTVGALLLTHMNVTLPARALIFSGLDLALVLFIGVWAVRRMTGSRVDIDGHVPPAPPLRRAALICLACIGAIWVHGMVMSGFSFDNSLWQLFRVVYLPCVFLLFCAALRGPADAPALAVVLLAAALGRAALAIYLRHLFPDLEFMPHATTHADSMLFSDAALLILLTFFERPTRRTLTYVALIVPVILWGIVANNRRMAWVELGASLVALYFVTRMTPLKRRIGQAVVVMSPVIVLYIAVGWNRPTGVFAPVRTVRSVVDSQADTSTLWRDLENYNLYLTIRENPILGTGFGHEYVEAVKLPDISTGYSLYRYAPHNSVLGLFAYCGPFGFAALWMLIPLGIYFALRNYRVAATARDRTAALTTVGILIAYVVHCYGDMGLGTWTSVFTVGAALALTAKQAVATGAWRIARNHAPQMRVVSGESIGAGEPFSVR